MKQSYKDAVTNAYTKIIKELQGIHHIQRYVMERLFWPTPELVGSVKGDEVWCVELLKQIDSSVDDAMKPLDEYLTKFDKYSDFLNLDVETYLSGLKHAQSDESDDEGGGDDDDGNDDSVAEGSSKLVKVNLDSLREVLSKHVTEKKDVLASIPETPLLAGLFNISTQNMRGMIR